MSWVMTMMATAAAQTVAAGAAPDLNAQLFRPTVDAQGLLLTDMARRGADGEPTLRLLGHYTSEPLAYLRDDGTKDALVSSVTQADLLVGYSYDRLRVGAALPVYLLSAGQAGNETGLGDVGLDAKVTLLDPGEVPIGLALQGRLELPTATVEAPLGDPTVGWSVAAVADADLGERVLVAANLAFEGGPQQALENLTVDDYLVLRAGPHVLIDPVSELGASLELFTKGALGGGSDPGAATAVEWLLGGHGRIAGSPAVLRAGGGTGLTSGVGTPEYRLLVGIGWEPRIDGDRDDDGIVDRDDACVAEPEDLDGFEDLDGCPDLDNDQDGVVDTADDCPMDPEDLDGFDDGDGCAEDDNDGDGLVDTADACPDEAEDRDGWADDDGCPELEVPALLTVASEEGDALDVARVTLTASGEPVRFTGRYEGGLLPGDYAVQATAPGYEPVQGTLSVADTAVEHTVVMTAVPTRVVVTRDRIDLKEKIYFDTGKATIQARSHALLDDTVGVLQEYPEIVKLRIEGHTDSRGSDSFNKDLSERRAASVRAYLEGKGIAAERLSSIGYGEERPLDEAKTSEAYAKNRRVDFFVETWDAEARTSE